MRLRLSARDGTSSAQGIAVFARIRSRLSLSMPETKKLLYQLRALCHAAELHGGSTKYFQLGSLVLTIKEARALADGRTTVEKLRQWKHERVTRSYRVLLRCPNCQQPMGLLTAQITGLEIFERIGCGHHWSAIARHP